MKKIYSKPEIELISFEPKDILTSSENPIWEGKNQPLESDHSLSNSEINSERE